MQMRWLPFVAAALLGALGPRSLSAAEPPATAKSPEDKKDRARALAVEGYELFEGGEYSRAITLLLDAEKLYHAPTIVVMLAQAHEKLGAVVEARAFYKAVIDEDLPRSAPKEFFEAKVTARRSYDALEGRFATVQVLVPGAKPGDVQVLIDGAQMEPFDGVHPQNPGTHKVTVSAAQGASISQSMALTAGSSERLLVPYAAVRSDGSGGSVVPAVVAFGVGVLGLGVGIGTGVLALNQRSDIDAACAKGSCAAGGDPSKAQTLETVSAVSFSVAGVGLATSAILLFVGRRGHSSSSSGSAAATSIGVGPGQVFLRGAF